MVIPHDWKQQMIRMLLCFTSDIKMPNLEEGTYEYEKC